MRRAKKPREAKNQARCRYCSREKTKQHNVRCWCCGWWRCNNRRLARRLKREENSS